LERELSKKRKEILAVSAVVIQAAYRASESHKVYQTDRNATIALEHPIRATLQRLDFYQRKWTWIEKGSRTGVVLGMRAAKARKLYYTERAKLFYDAICAHMHCVIHATIKRQEYYELKMKYLEHEMLDKERQGMAKYEVFSRDFEAEKAHQLRTEGYERRLCAAEEEYSLEINAALALEKFAVAKERHAMVCEQHYMRAGNAIALCRAHTLEAEWRAEEMASKQEQIDAITMERCREAMVRMGLFSTITAATRPSLTPLPSPAPGPKFKFQLDTYRDANVKGSAAGKVVESLQNRSMSGATEAQRSYVARVAGLIDEQPAVLFQALSGSKHALSRGIEAPSKAGRR